MARLNKTWIVALITLLIAGASRAHPGPLHVHVQETQISFGQALSAIVMGAALLIGLGVLSVKGLRNIGSK